MLGFFCFCLRLPSRRFMRFCPRGGGYGGGRAGRISYRGHNCKGHSRSDVPGKQYGYRRKKRPISLFRFILSFFKSFSSFFHPIKACATQFNNAKSPDSVFCNTILYGSAPLFLFLLSVLGLNLKKFQNASGWNFSKHGLSKNRPFRKKNGAKGDFSLAA